MQNKPREELARIALGIHNQTIFTNFHVNENVSLLTVFMRLLMDDQMMIDAYLDDPPGMIYENLSEATPYSINGYPVFFTCQFLSVEDTHIVKGILERLQRAVRDTLVEVVLEETSLTTAEIAKRFSDAEQRAAEDAG